MRRAATPSILTPYHHARLFSRGLLLNQGSIFSTLPAGYCYSSHPVLAMTAESLTFRCLAGNK